MRDFFIQALEWIIHVVVVLTAVGIALVTIGALFGGVPVGTMVIEGPLPAALVAIGGTLCDPRIDGQISNGLPVL